MARFLGIDWDHNSLYLVSGSINRKKAGIEQAVVWELPHTLDAAAAEEAGKKLRARLKEAKIAPGAVLACLGRERVIFKELRFPAVEANQEAALVQFQATKELTEPANRVVMDYARLKPAAGDKERRAILTVARKPLVQSLHALCKGAGLGLVCLAPRPFGIARCLQQSSASALATPTPAAGASVAVLTLSKRWAEFSIVRDGEIRLARPLTIGENLLEDVRRNLALYANQSQANSARDSVQALYFSGDAEHTVILESLKEALAIPVHSLDPFASEEHVKVSGDRGSFAGIVGLAQLWAEQQTPVNLVSPKEPKPETGDKRRMAVLVAALLLVLVAGGFVIGQVELSNKEKELKDRKQQLVEMGLKLDKMKPDAEKLGLLRDWDESALHWADEFHKLTKHFPQVEGFRLTSVNVTPLPPSAAGDENFTMHMNLKGVVPADKTYLVDELIGNINSDPLWRAKREFVKEGKNFSIQVDLAKPPVELNSKVRLGPGLKKPGSQVQGTK